MARSGPLVGVSMPDFFSNAAQPTGGGGRDRRLGVHRPCPIVLTAFVFWPIARVFWVSFHEWSLIEPEQPWRGWANYREVFHDPDFEIALRNTIWFSLGVVPIQTFLGVLLAVLANRAIPGKRFLPDRILLPVHQLVGGDFGHLHLALPAERADQLRAAQDRVRHSATALVEQPQGHLRNGC